MRPSLSRIVRVPLNRAGALYRIGRRSSNLLQELGRVISRVSDLMLLVGLIYRAVNARWIRRSLRAPGPSLEEVLPP